MTLDELQKLCDEATPGPWAPYADGTILGPSGMLGTATDFGDRQFIAAARTYLPRLLAVARAAKEAQYQVLGEAGAAIEVALAALEAP